MSTIASNLPASSTPSASSTAATNAALNLSPSDFINLMVTQLENQDPTNPTSNTDLLAQMSQIGQLESSTQLQTTLTSITLQTQIGAAGNMIGKNVSGLDDSGNTATGTVNSVKVQNNLVYLQLDSGSSLQMGNVTSISNPAATTTPTATTPAATTPTGA